MVLRQQSRRAPYKRAKPWREESKKKKEEKRKKKS
jgi:hypothetical protein